MPPAPPELDAPPTKPGITDDAIALMANAAQADITTLRVYLTQRRTNRGDLPQEKLAARMHMATTCLADWESDRCHPGVERLLRWAWAVDTYLALFSTDGAEITPVALRSARPPQAWPLLVTALRIRREALGISQQQLADALGVTLRSVVRWESKDITYPRFNTLFLWARVLGCSLRAVSFVCLETAACGDIRVLVASGYLEAIHIPSVVDALAKLTRGTQPVLLDTENLLADRPDTLARLIATVRAHPQYYRRMYVVRPLPTSPQ